MAILKKIVSISTVLYSCCVVSWATDSLPTNVQGSGESLSLDTNLPVVTVQKTDGGVQQITVTSMLADGSQRIVTVKIDLHGNKEVVIKTIDRSGRESVSVLGKDSQVTVQETPRVSIGEDGTLVSPTEETSSSS